MIPPGTPKSHNKNPFAIRSIPFRAVTLSPPFVLYLQQKEYHLTFSATDREEKKESSE